MLWNEYSTLQSQLHIDLIAMPLIPPLMRIIAIKCCNS